MFPLPAARTYEEGMPSEVGIPRFGDDAVPVSYGIGVDTVCFSTPYYGSEEPVSVPGFRTSTYYFVDGPHRQEPERRSGSRTGLASRGFGPGRADDVFPFP